MLLIVPQYKLWFSFPHPGILYIAAAARQAGEFVELIDGGVLSETKYFKLIEEKIPAHDKIAMTVSVAHIASAVKTANFVRKKFPDKKIIWGGPYASSQFKNLPEDIADTIVIGEGEKTIQQICKNVPLSKIPSIAYFENGKIKINLRESYINDLDELPFPAYDLVNFNSYHSPGFKPIGQIISTRGCPFKCTNCTKSIHGDNYRKRSPENTLEEISLLVDKYKVREIHFWDDNFTLDLNRVKKICELILKEELHKKVRFAIPAGIRADIYEKEAFTLMKKANFYLFSVAIESGSQEIINKIDKKLDLKKVPENLQKMEKHGFRLILYFMMGFPWETNEEMLMTANFAGSLPGHHLSCFAVTPLPGSKLFDEWKEAPDFKNYLSVSYDNPIPQARSPEKTKELKKMIRKTYLNFYLNPHRILNTISLMHKQKSLFSDFSFAARNFFNILFSGHK